MSLQLSFTDFHISSADNSIMIFIILLAVPFLLLFPLFTKYVHHRKMIKQIKSRTIVSLYKSPNDLTPAEIGYLYDIKISKKEFIATVFDLEYRKFILIDTDGNLKINNKNEDSLNEFEKYIINLIKEGNLKSINDFIDPLVIYTFKSMVRKKLVLAGYLGGNLIGGFIKSVFKFTGKIYLFSIITFIIYWLGSVFYYNAQIQAFSSYGIFSLLILLLVIFIFSIFYMNYYIFAGLILTIIFVKINGTSWIGTSNIKKIWNDIEGYKIFIKQAQLDRLQFESNEIKQASVEKDYSYAVALGMNIDWKNRFNK